MQLEKIRSADQNVRWQDEDDVDNCPNCKKEFTVTRRKVCIIIFKTQFANLSIMIHDQKKNFFLE